MHKYQMETHTAISRALQVFSLVLLGFVTIVSLIFVQIFTANAGAISDDTGTTEFMTSLGSNSDEAVRGVLVTPLSDTGKAGDSIQIVTAVLYYGDRVKENVTSCFPCPTPDNFSDGTVSYKVVKGPAVMDWSKIVIDNNAQIDDEIILQASYYDNKSDTTGTSMLTRITVGTTSADDVIAQAVETKKLAEEQRLADIAVAEDQGLADIASAKAEEALNQSDIFTIDEKTEEALNQSAIFTIDEKALVETIEDKLADETPLLKAAAGTQQRNGIGTIYWVIAVIALLALAVIIAEKRMLKINHESPEHRAMENELYEAFGEKHQKHLPKNHNEKNTEVHKAFDHMED